MLLDNETQRGCSAIGEPGGSNVQNTQEKAIAPAQPQPPLGLLLTHLPGAPLLIASNQSTQRRPDLSPITSRITCKQNPLQKKKKRKDIEHRNSSQQRSVLIPNCYEMPVFSPACQKPSFDEMRGVIRSKNRRG